MDGSLDWENSYPDVIANGAVAPPDSLAAVKGQVSLSPATTLYITALSVVLNSRTDDSLHGVYRELHSCSCRACSCKQPTQPICEAGCSNGNRVFAALSCMCVCSLAAAVRMGTNLHILSTLQRRVHNSVTRPQAEVATKAERVLTWKLECNNVCHTKCWSLHLVCMHNT